MVNERLRIHKKISIKNKNIINNNKLNINIRKEYVYKKYFFSKKEDYNFLKKIKMYLSNVIRWYF